MVSELIEYYGLKVVQAYMNYIQKNAEVAVRDLLRIVGTRTLERTGKNVLTAQDYMDDGSLIQLTVSINVESGSAVFDFRFVLLFITYIKFEERQTSFFSFYYFSGTGYEVWGNCNAPKAITLSAVIYCLRCMVGHDVPLNQVH